MIGSDSKLIFIIVILILLLMFMFVMPAPAQEVTSGIPSHEPVIPSDLDAVQIMQFRVDASWRRELRERDTEEFFQEGGQSDLCGGESAVRIEGEGGRR